MFLQYAHKAPANPPPALHSWSDEQILGLIPQRLSTAQRFVAGDIDHVLPANPAAPSIDLDAFAKVGKISFGDAELGQPSAIAPAQGVGREARHRQRIAHWLQ